MNKTVPKTESPRIDDATADESVPANTSTATGGTSEEFPAPEKVPPPAVAHSKPNRKPHCPNLIYAKRVNPAGYYELTEAGYELIFEMSRRAAENHTIASALGCSRETFRTILKRDERAQEQLSLGRARMSSDLGNVLFQEAMGERSGTPNILASIYLTKARCGWTDRGDRPLDGVTTLNQVNIQLGPKLTDDEWKNFVEGSMKLVGGPSDDKAD